MSSPKFISRNRMLGTSTWWHEPDTPDPRFAFQGGYETRYDPRVTQAILDRNQELRNHDNGYSPSKEFRRIGTIPAEVLALWREKYGLDINNPDHADAIMRLFNDSEWSRCRTADWNV